VLKELMAEKVQETILNVLVARFARGAEAIQSELHQVKADKRPHGLAKQAAVCPDPESFRKLLES
jgi:hypothetical protein